jgi:hypothetical protein
MIQAISLLPFPTVAISGLPQHVNLATLYLGYVRVTHFGSFHVLAHEGSVFHHVAVSKV